MSNSHPSPIFVRLKSFSRIFVIKYFNKLATTHRNVKKEDCLAYQSELGTAQN
jgi:hypothetical protein